jgi:hypothetical protein
MVLKRCLSVSQAIIDSLSTVYYYYTQIRRPISMGPPRHSLLSRMNPLHILKSCWLKIYFNITLPHIPRSPHVISSAQVSKLKERVNYLSIAYYMSSPSHPLNVITNYKALRYAIFSSLLIHQTSPPPLPPSLKCSSLYFTQNIFYAISLGSATSFTSTHGQKFSIQNEPFVSVYLIL